MQADTGHGPGAGEILIEHTRPAPGVIYVGNGRPRGPRTNTAELSPIP